MQKSASTQLKQSRKILKSTKEQNQNPSCGYSQPCLKSKKPPKNNASCFMNLIEHQSCLDQGQQSRSPKPNLPSTRGHTEVLPLITIFFLRNRKVRPIRKNKFKHLIIQRGFLNQIQIHYFIQRNSFSFQHDDYVQSEHDKFIKAENLLFPEDHLSWHEQEKICLQDIEFPSDCLEELVQEQLAYESDYKFDSLYLRNQKNIQPFMRAMLLDWMIEVASAFNLKRETYYLSQNYVDRYLSRIHHCETSQLQLLGITALFVAQKLEEVVPLRIVEFEKTTDRLYTCQQIEEMEIDIMRTLKFRLNPSTPIFWMNYYIWKWDEMAARHFKHLVLKKNGEESYNRFRELCQIFDCLQLDYNSLDLEQRKCILAILQFIKLLHSIQKKKDI